MAFVIPVVEHWLEREIAQWVLPMKDRPDDPSHHERTLLPRSYISLREKRESSGLTPTQYLPVYWPTAMPLNHRGRLNCYTIC